VEIKY